MVDNHELKTKKDYQMYRFIYTDGTKAFQPFPSKSDAVAFALAEGDHLIDFELVTYEKE